MKRVLGSVILTACLLAAFVVPASAHGAVPHPASCTNVVDEFISPIYTSVPNGTLKQQVWIEEVKDSVTGASCNTWRAVMAYKSNTGSNVSVTARSAGLVWYPSNSDMTGSWSSNFSTVTATTSWTDYAGPWVSSIPCGWTFYSQGSVQASNNDLAENDTGVASGQC